MGEQYKIELIENPNGGHVETIEEFIARGGKITKCAPYKDPNPFYVNDGPRPSLAEYMKRKKYHV